MRGQTAGRPMRTAWLIAAGLIAMLFATGCGSSSSSSSRNTDMAQSVGKGEGELNLVAWAGYVANPWKSDFEKATGCQVNVKVAGTSDQMVQLMRQGGYDGVSASGNASARLVDAGDVSPVNVGLVPNYQSIYPDLKDQPYNTFDGTHYGIPHGRGANLLMWNKDDVKPAPTSWDVMLDPKKAAAYKGKISVYDDPIYIADAAVYLKAHQPDLGIDNPYELNKTQFDAAVNLLKTQHGFIGKYWEAYSDEIDNFTSGATVVGTTWPYQTNTLKGSGVKVEAVVPTEGMTGWADTWMLASKAKHPNCMYKWMAWMVTPHVQTQVAEYFGEAPANPKACAELDKTYGSYGVKDFCTLYSVNDKAFYDAISFWKTPQADCGDTRGQTCVSYDKWVTAFQAVKAGS